MYIYIYIQITYVINNINRYLKKTSTIKYTYASFSTYVKLFGKWIMRLRDNRNDGYASEGVFICHLFYNTSLIWTNMKITGAKSVSWQANESAQKIRFKQIIIFIPPHGMVKALPLNKQPPIMNRHKRVQIIF